MVMNLTLATKFFEIFKVKAPRLSLVSDKTLSPIDFYGRVRLNAVAGEPTVAG